MRYSSCFAAMLLLFGAAFVGCTKTAETTVTPETVEATAVSFANAKCPIMGGKPNAELTAQYEGELIGFCCDGCPEKWAALSDGERAGKFAAVDAEADHEGHDHADHSHE